MDCFRPQTNDGYLRLVPSQVESCKRIRFKLFNEHIQLCNSSGQVLGSYPLDNVNWTPCALPGGKDHCIALQIHSDGPKELLFRAANRTAVASLVAKLDLAAQRLASKLQQQQETIHVHAMADIEDDELTDQDQVVGEEMPPEEEPSLTNPLNDSISFGPDDQPRLAPALQLSNAEEVQSRQTSGSSVRLLACPARTEDAEPAPCPNCRHLESMTAEHVAQAKQLQEISRELNVALERLDVSHNDSVKLEKRLADAHEDVVAHGQALEAATKREAELRTSLAEAVTRCEELTKELQSLFNTSEAKETRCQELLAALATSQEEQKVLVAALTTAQAQLHDVQLAFQDAASQLEGAARSCADARSQAAAAQGELATARKEAEKASAAAKAAEKERDAALHDLRLLREDKSLAQQQWLRERAGMDNALSLMRDRIDATQRDRSLAESLATSESASALNARIDELNRQLAEARREGVGMEQSERERRQRAQEAALDAVRAQLNESQRRETEATAALNALKNQIESVDGDKDTRVRELQQEISGLRAKLAASEREARGAEERAASAEKVAEDAMNQAAQARSELSAALVAQTNAARERRTLADELDRLAVERQRAQRERDALDLQVKVLQALATNICD